MGSPSSCSVCQTSFPKMSLRLSVLSNVTNSTNAIFKGLSWKETTTLFEKIGKQRLLRFVVKNFVGSITVSVQCVDNQDSEVMLARSTSRKQPRSTKFTIWCNGSEICEELFLHITESNLACKRHQITLSAKSQSSDEQELYSWTFTTAKHNFETRSMALTSPYYPLKGNDPVEFILPTEPSNNASVGTKRALPDSGSFGAKRARADLEPIHIDDCYCFPYENDNLPHERVTDDFSSVCSQYESESLTLSCSDSQSFCDRAMSEREPSTCEVAVPNSNLAAQQVDCNLEDDVSFYAMLASTSGYDVANLGDDSLLAGTSDSNVPSPCQEVDPFAVLNSNLATQQVDYDLEDDVSFYAMLASTSGCGVANSGDDSLLSSTSDSNVPSRYQQ